MYYPYEGVLYLASAPSLQAQGLLKYGETRQAPQARESQHPGQLSLEASTMLFIIETKDRMRAEALARALFKQAGMLIPGRERKELIQRDIERAKRILQEAVARAEVRTAPLLVAAQAPQVQVESKSCAWRHLLAHRLRIGGQSHPVQHWMAMSLRCAKTARQLERRGIYCVNWDPRRPDFQIQALDPQMALALSSAGFSTEELLDGSTGAPQVTLALAA